MSFKSVFILLLLPFSLCAATQSDYYVKQVEFPSDATLEQKLDMASRVVPTEKQRDWQNLELTAFLHFGINTFTDREWGDGKESPSIFNPARFDARQWVKTLSDAGFKMVILTAKHHDGFCLWPTKTTRHSVKHSPWLNGNGDVMAQLREACDFYGMKLGVYLSPWDRNAECYGDSPAYNDMFVAQLTELLSDYGRIDEVWFDGACGEGPNGKKQIYDWDRYKKTIERLQPEAVVAIMGDDVRWVGNEKGLGRETEWSVTALTPGILPDAEAKNKALGLFPKAKDLGGADIVSKAERLYWWPSEVDVSIRPGWFWHTKEKPKSLRELARIYLHSVGRNSVLLLNVPPTPEGLIDRADSIRLTELRKWIDTNFSANLAQPGSDHHTVSLKSSAPFNCVVLREDIAQGQRVERFNILAKKDNKWEQITQGTTIGNKRILTFPEITADSVKVDIVSARGRVNLLPPEIYEITLPQEDNSIQNLRKQDKSNWKIVSASCAAVDSAYTAIDNKVATFWLSADCDNRHIIVDLGAPETFGGFSYQPRTDDRDEGIISRYRFYIADSADGPWRAIKEGEFSNILNNPIQQNVFFDIPVTARFIKLESIEEVHGRDIISVAEISIL